MTTPLIYPGTGRTMDLVPKNITMEACGALLRRSLPVVVQLEPGDATHYALLLTPCWSPGLQQALGRYGIPIGEASRYLLVTQLIDGDGQQPTIWWLWEHPQAFLLEDLARNPWTQQIVLAFLIRLGEELNR